MMIFVHYYYFFFFGTTNNVNSFWSKVAGALTNKVRGVMGPSKCALVAGKDNKPKLQASLDAMQAYNIFPSSLSVKMAVKLARRCGYCINPRGYLSDVVSIDWSGKKDDLITAPRSNSLRYRFFRFGYQLYSFPSLHGIRAMALVGWLLML